MIAVLSPAKKLDESPLERKLPTTSPIFPDDIRALHETAKNLSKDELQSLMKLSDNLTELNYDRFQSMAFPSTEDNAKPAALLFAGDTFTGLDAPSMSKDDLVYAQDHVRILSGLYGILRPLDLIQPYRLEMGTRLKNDRGKNLYEFWGDKLTNALNKALADHRDPSIVRVASNEYFSAIQPEKLDGEVIDITFKEMRDGELKQISFYAKKARGMMARFIVTHRIEDVEALKSFDDERYQFQDYLSSDTELVFTRPDSRR